MRILQHRIGRSVVLLILTIFILIFSYQVVESNRIGQFTISEYSSQIDQFPSENYLGNIESIANLKTKVDDLFYLQFNKRSSFIQPLSVSYDSEEECYLIHGTLLPGSVGGVPFAIVLKMMDK